jgi:chemosensory pili system protein ChpC
MTAATKPVTAAPVDQEEPSDLSCILMPLKDCQLLVPSVCIAEITPWRRVKPLQNGPDWCLGSFVWRGETVPVIRFERLNHPRAQCAPRGRCLVVMNRTGSDGGTPFYALAVEGLPRLVQLADGDISQHDGRLGRAESLAVRLGTETASIPNLGFLEQQVGRLPLLH